MGMDKTKADEYLKDEPWRDLTFRAVLWLVISGVASLVAFQRGLSALDVLDRTAQSIGPLVNLVGTFAVFLALPALALKDLEFLCPSAWGQESRRGRAGGWVRRLAGDLMLWTLGAFTALLSAVGTAVLVAGVGRAERWKVAGVFGQVLLVTLVAAVITILVRRGAPSPLVREISGVTGIVLAYSVTIAVGALSVLRSG